MRGGRLSNDSVPEGKVRRPRLKNRRGATIVFFALVLIPLIAIGAMAIDMSFWQMGATQLQNIADASALAGARALQRNPTTGTASATADVNAVAAQNYAFNTAGTADVIEVGRWDPTTRQFNAAGTPQNAVRVESHAVGHVIFGGGVGQGSKTISRSAIAWIANINGASCVQPYALPYPVLYKKVTGVTAPAWPDTAPTLTQDQLLPLGDLPESQRTVVMIGPTMPLLSSATHAYKVTQPASYDAQWNAYSFSGNAGIDTYQSWIYGCSSTVVNVNADGGTTLPNQSSQGLIECRTIVAIQGGTSNASCNSNANQYIDPSVGTGASVTCYYKAPTDNGLQGANLVTTYTSECYVSQSATTPGRLVTVAWGDNIGTGSNTVNYRMLGKFKLLCVFRQPEASGQAKTHETCTSAGLSLTDYPRGTIVGIIQGIDSATLGPDTVLGNTISDQQRLILVK